MLGKVQLFAPDFTVISGRSWGGVGDRAGVGGGRNLSSHQTCGPTSPEGRRETEGREGWPTLAQVSPIENLRENKPGLCFNSIHSELLKLCNLQKKKIKLCQGLL